MTIKFKSADIFKRNINLMICFLMCLLNGCCNENEDSSGSISADLDISNYTDWDDYGCFHFPDTMCIRDDSTYQQQFKIISSDDDCKQLSLPVIDFSKYSLLVYRKSEGGRIFYHRNVSIDTVNKIVRYSISNSKCFCPDKCQSGSLNMVLIPKVGNEYAVEYK
jgi:hypothetical protein